MRGEGYRAEKKEEFTRMKEVGYLTEERVKRLGVLTKATDWLFLELEGE